MRTLVQLRIGRLFQCADAYAHAIAHADAYANADANAYANAYVTVARFSQYDTEYFGGCVLPWYVQHIDIQ